MDRLSDLQFSSVNLRKLLASDRSHPSIASQGGDHWDSSCCQVFVFFVTSAFSQLFGQSWRRTIVYIYIYIVVSDCQQCSIIGDDDDGRQRLGYHSFIVVDSQQASNGYQMPGMIGTLYSKGKQW